jgi:quercetin dioxygenase-like cupin family protein
MKEYWRHPDEGEAIWLLGGLYTFKSLGDENRNAYTVVEVLGSAGFAAPMHFHEREEEGFYVAEGQATLFIGEETISARSGSWAFVPRGVKHAFRLDSPETRLLLLITPGAAGHEGLFREMGDPAESHAIPPPPQEPPDPQRLAEIAARHGTTIVGPPPGD